MRGSCRRFFIHPLELGFRAADVGTDLTRSSKYRLAVLIELLDGNAQLYQEFFAGAHLSFEPVDLAA